MSRRRSQSVSKFKMWQSVRPKAPDGLDGLLTTLGAETRYVNSEREYLAMIQCLSKVKWLVIGNPYPVMIYSDHTTLRDIFVKGNSEKARINGWLNRLGEFDLKLVYRPSTD